MKYYSRYLTHLAPLETIEDNIIYDGCRNYMYEKNSRVENASDVLSVYEGLRDGTLFFMHKLLNSYSINERVAKHFIVLNRSINLKCCWADKSSHLIHYIYYKISILE